MSSPNDQIVRAKIHSLGGLFFLGTLVLFAVLVLNAFFAFAFHPIAAWLLVLLLGSALVYVIDGVSERLAQKDGNLFFDSLFHRKRTVSLRDVKRIQFVHEGLNMEKGIESIRVQYRDGKEQRLALGPFWHRHQVMAFLRAAIEGRGARLEEWQ